MIEIKRRVPDYRTVSIEDMIAAEDDAKQRSFLIVMNNMSVNLQANTDMIQDISRKFESHQTKYEAQLDAEQARLHQGQGMKKVVLWLAGVLQVVVLALCAQLTHSLIDINNSITALHVVDARTEERVINLEKTTNVTVIQEKK